MNTPQHPLRPISWWWALIGVAVVAASTALSTWWFLELTPDAGSRLDAVKTGLSVGVGTGAVVGFLVAIHRLRLSERVHAHTEYDALERRITDLYTKAADQLGSDKGPVRLAGLYALERLAQDNPGHRQTVVNLICAYLRMPYSPPSDSSEDRASTRRAPLRLNQRRYRATHTKTQPLEADSNVEDKPDPREEQQVRLAAQHILTDHLGAHGGSTRLLTSPAPLWDGIRIDLTGATLIDFELTNATIGDATFYETTFINAAVFHGATFTGNTNFACATFSRFGAHFNNASFSATSTSVTLPSAPTPQTFPKRPSAATCDSGALRSNPKRSISPKPKSRTSAHS